MGEVKRACGNCRHWTPPNMVHKLGPCSKKGEWAGTLRTPRDWYCKDFEATVARRLGTVAAPC